MSVLIAALKKVEQFQLLLGNTVGPGLGPHQEIRVAKADFRGEARAGSLKNTDWCGDGVLLI